jgi:hypothetical protein
MDAVSRTFALDSAAPSMVTAVAGPVSGPGSSTVLTEAPPVGSAGRLLTAFGADSYAPTHSDLLRVYEVDTHCTLRQYSFSLGKQDFLYDSGAHSIAQHSTSRLSAHRSPHPVARVLQVGGCGQPYEGRPSQMDARARRHYSALIRR